MSIRVREVVRKRPNRVFYEARVGSAPGVLCGAWKILVRGCAGLGHLWFPFVEIKARN